MFSKCQIVGEDFAIFVAFLKNINFSYLTESLMLLKKMYQITMPSLKCWGFFGTYCVYQNLTEKILDRIRSKKHNL